MRATVKPVFLLAYLLDMSSLIWLKDIKVLTKITSSLNGVPRPIIALYGIKC